MKNDGKNLQMIEAIDLQEILNAIEVLKAKFIPYTKEATNEEKAVIAKMSDKSYAFVEKSLERSIHHPLLVPSFVDMEEYQQQVAHMEQLRILEAHIRELNKAAHDTLMLVSSEVYQTSLIFYNNVKSGAKNNIPGAQSIYEELKGRFESQGQRGPKKEDSKEE